MPALHAEDARNARVKPSQPSPQRAALPARGPGLLTLGFGLALGLFGALSQSEAAPTTHPRAAVAACQSGCDVMRDDQLRALCKLRCFDDPTTALAPSPSAPPPKPAPKASPPQPAAATSAPQPSAPAAPATSTSTSQAPGGGEMRKTTSGGRSASDVAACQRRCDADTSRSDTDRATCRLGCESGGTSVTTWSVTGSPAEVRCAKKCHCEASCADDLRRCRRSCGTMSDPNARASCSLQCDNEAQPCQRSCQPKAPTPDCSCG